MSSQVRTVLAAELRQLADDLAQHAPQLGVGCEEAASQCLGLCERLGQVAGIIEAPALQEVAMFLMSNIPGLIGDADQTQAPARLCTELELCLLEGDQSQRWAHLATHLADARWPSSLSVSTAQELIEGLRPLATEQTDPVPVCAPSLTPQELTLQAPDDVGRETLQAFFQEAPLQATQLSRLLANLSPGTSPDDIAAVQRLAHTLKGSGALCGLHAIAHLTHALEERLQNLDPANDLAQSMRDKLVEAGDMLGQLIELAATAGTAPDHLAGLIAGLYDQTISQTPAVSEQAMPASEAATTPTAVVVENESAVAPTPTLSVPTPLIDENLRRAGEINLAIGQLTMHVGTVLDRANRLAQQLGVVQAQVYELETLVDTRGIPSVHARQQGAANDFDPLELDEYTALHSLSRAFAESTLDSRELSRDLGDELLKLQNLLAQHARLGRELNDGVMSTRLVSVATIVPRLERIVRQTARQTDRAVELEIVGRDLSIDTEILTGLVEPLMHALRNAIDHGIEPAPDRLARGKPPTGHIKLRFRREGNRIEITCEDDGRGLDLNAIERRARERGLLLAGQQPNPAQLASLIFVPGFSTRDEVTSISGRGVGMDVVRASIERIKGSVHIESRDGAGCTLSLRLPLSLTSAHALFVAVGEGVYGLPGTSVEQVLYSDAGRIVQLGEQYAFEYGTEVCPLHSLAALLGQHSEVLESLTVQPRPLVIVNSDTGRVALAVDRALDSRQVVVKGLSTMLPTLPGVAGACVLPNGSVGVILEVRELLRQPIDIALAPRETVSVAPSTRRAARALIVDDSLSARRALAQLLSDCGYEVATAFDGLDAIGRIEAQTPDVVLADLEMPRMNGLELTAHLRGNPATQNVPIVMITSRAAEKHRAQALRAGVTEYLTKPYIEHQLLDRLLSLVPP